MGAGERERSTGKTAVITGASSGIGRATAVEFAARGFDVAVLARRKELLDSLLAELTQAHPKQKFIAYRCDVRRYDEVVATFGKIGEDFGAVDVLVNNAGAFEYLSLEKSQPEKLDEMIDVNLRGVVYVSKAALPLLRRAVAAHKSAKVVNVSSIAGLWGFSNMSVYTATKFAVAGFSGGLRREWRREGIQVSTIHPGPVRSKTPPGQRAENMKRLEMLPHQIASQIFELATSRRHTRVSHPAFRILHALERVSPSVVDKLLKKLM